MSLSCACSTVHARKNIRFVCKRESVSRIAAHQVVVKLKGVRCKPSRSWRRIRLDRICASGFAYLKDYVIAFGVEYQSSTIGRRRSFANNHQPQQSLTSKSCRHARSFAVQKTKTFSNDFHRTAINLATRSESNQLQHNTSTATRMPPPVSARRIRRPCPPRARC